MESAGVAVEPLEETCDCEWNKKCYVRSGEQDAFKVRLVAGQLGFPCMSFASLTRFAWANVRCDYLRRACTSGGLTFCSYFLSLLCQTA